MSIKQGDIVRVKHNTTNGRDGRCSGRTGEVMVADDDSLLVAFPSWHKGHNGTGVLESVTKRIQRKYGKDSAWWLSSHEVVLASQEVTTVFIRGQESKENDLSIEELQAKLS